MIVKADRREKRYQFLRVFFAFSCIAVFVLQRIDGHPRAPLGLVGLLFLPVPELAHRVLKLRFGYRIKTLILLFCLFAYNLGVAFDWYNKYRFYDDLMHTLSGVLFTLIGLCISARMEDADGGPIQYWRRRLVFAFCFSLAIALIWEVYEFGGYLLTGSDMQNHETTGVFDTMGDMIVCLVGSLLMAFDYAYCAKRGKRSYLLSCFEEFLELNPKNSERDRQVDS